MKNEVIEHTGIVERVGDNLVVVRIMQASACSACKARSFCASSENKEKMIEVHSPVINCKAGDEVTVCATASMGRDAVVLAFVIPLVLMMATLAATLKITHSEPIAALAGVGILLPYYIVLYTQKNRLSRKMNFWIK